MKIDRDYFLVDFPTFNRLIQKSSVEITIPELSEGFTSDFNQRYAMTYTHTTSESLEEIIRYVFWVPDHTEQYHLNPSVVMKPSSEISIVKVI